jgi:hypothetical protein
MITKTIEIRDRHTLVPALAIQVSGEDGYLCRRAGFGNPMVYLLKLATQECRYDPWAWGDRTLKTAHLHIAEYFDDLADGAVVDVEFLLGETQTPKASEQLTHGEPA